MNSGRFLIDIVAPTLILCWAAISIYSAAAGEAGFGALSSMERDVAAKTVELEALRARRMELEKHADQLASRSLDSDLADERIRTILGYARDGDIIVTKDALEKALENN